ncbi:MAG: hypothetical protein ABI333_16130 [bacterium]
MWPKTARYVSIVTLLVWVGGCGGSTGGDVDATADASGLGDAEPDGSTVTWEGAVGDVTFVGPWGGATTVIVEDPTQAGRVYAVVGDRPFRSDDDGATWQRLADPPAGRALSLLVLPDGRVAMGSDVDVLISADQGDSWQDITGNMEAGLGYGIMAHGLAYETGNATRLWAALNTYSTAPLWFLPEGDTTWQPWNAPAGWDTNPLNGAALFRSIDARVDSGSGQTFIFTTYEESFGSGGGVFCSVDSGATWNDCSGSLPAVPYNRVRIFDGQIVLAGGQMFGSAYAGVYYSEDDGASWTQAVGGWSEPVGNDFIRLQSGEFVVATYGNGILRSADLTAPWTAFPGFDGMEVHTLIELASGELLAGPEQLGVARNADDGTPWSFSSEGLELAAVDSVAVDPAEPMSLLAAMSSLNSGLVLHTTEGLAGWHVIDTLPFPRYSLVHISGSGRWYVVSDGPTGQANDGIYRSVDGGGTWEFLGPEQGSMMDHDLIGILELEQPQRLVTAGQYWAGGERRPFLLETTDGGATWSQLWLGEPDHASSALVRSPEGSYLIAVQNESIVRVSATGDTSETLTIPAVVDGQVTALAGCEASADRLAAVGLVDDQTYDFGVFYSADGGTTWSTLDFAPNPNERPRFVALHPHDCSLVFLSTSEGRLLHSSDAGLSWTDLDLGATLGITGLRVVPVAANHEAVLLVYGTGGAVAVRLTSTPVD